MKEQNAQHTNELKKLSGVHEASVMSTSEEHQKTLKKLRDQISALENTALTSGKGDKEKDKTIAVSCIFQMPRLLIVSFSISV